MQVVDREVVRRLVESRDPEAALVFVGGECVVASIGEAAVPEAGVLIVRRHEIEPELAGGPISEEMLDAVAQRLDNRARDMGA